MRIITINISEPAVKALQVLQDLGLYPSRSEAIRVAVRDFLQRELGFAQKFEDVPPKKPGIDGMQSADKKAEIGRLLQKLRQEQPDLELVA
jgi:Arc/MetJ-type ribon-helix-helix transcriptional regulator